MEELPNKPVYPSEIKVVNELDDDGYTMSFVELRGRLRLNVVDEFSHPALIFYYIIQCRKHIKTGRSWSELGTTEAQLQELLERSKAHHIDSRILHVLKRNFFRPLTLADAEELHDILCQARRRHIKWKYSSYTRRFILTMIELATRGYAHCRSIAA